MRYGYSYVTDKGFGAFAHDLSEGAWKDVAIKKYDAPDQMPAAPLLEAPRPVAWKLRALWGIGRLNEAIGGSPTEVLQKLDAEWDSSQRALNLFLGAAVEHPDQAHREAGLRLRKALLSGEGTAQTILSLDAEVDFGRHQMMITATKPLADDVKKVGIAAHLKRIGEATEALATGIGRSPGQSRAAAPSKRLREAMAGCTTAFNAIHDELSWLIEHTPAGDDRAHLEALHAPFLALLDRYPPRESPAQAGGGGGTPEVPADSDTENTPS
jgi:hypothetical protein